MPGSEQHRAILDKNKETIQDRQLPFHLKTSNGLMCLTNNDLWLPNMVSQKTTDKLRTAQTAMKRNMLGLKIRYHAQKSGKEQG